jgi:SAM-dependent methyltransferase
MFYDETLRQLIGAGTISTSDKVLVVCGGSYDADVLKGLGFKSVTLSNLDGSYAGHDADYVWERQDTENLTYGNDQFDVAMVHAGLHHCASPHRALLEMYRVARKAVVVFEARDSLMMRAAVSLGFTGEFELEAVSGEGYESGGLNNGPIPNLNFRWTEREVVKTIRAADPAHEEKIDFFYGLRLPTLRFEHVNAPARRIALKLIGPAVQRSWRCFPNRAISSAS